MLYDLYPDQKSIPADTLNNGVILSGKSESDSLDSPTTRNKPSV